MLTFFAVAVVIGGVGCAILNLLAAIFLRDGRGIFRLFAFFMCSAVAGAYYYILTVGPEPSLTPVVGRVLVAGLLTVAGGWAGIDLYVWARLRGDK